jgi:hypothetical protein
MRIVGQGAAAEAGDASEGIGDAFDQSERRGRCAECRGQQAGEQRSGDLVPDVGQQARGSDARDAGPEPAGLDLRCIGRRHSGDSTCPRPGRNSPDRLPS